MISRPTPVFFAILLCLSGSLFGQAWSGILDPSRAVDWSNVGANISTSRTQCVTSQCATVSGGNVSSASLNAAIASAPPNTYVLVPQGVFNLNASVVFANGGNPVSNVTLRGAGSNSTVLTFTSTGSSYSYCNSFNICAASGDTNNPTNPSNSASWTGGYNAGSRSIVLNNISGTAPAVGAPIILDQIDNQRDNGGLYVGCEIGSAGGGDPSPACYSGAGYNSFERGKGSLSTIRGQQQIVTVTSVSGSGPYTVGITPGLYAPNWNSAQSPGAWWSSRPVYNDGIENLKIIPSSNSSGAVFWFNCQGCWAKGVAGVIISSPSATGWGDFVLQQCNHCTVRDSYFYGAANLDDYAIAAEGASDLLVENNIFQFPGTSQFYNADCEGCVASYNFSVNPVYSSSSTWLVPSSDYHGTNLFSLQEGNIGTGLYADSFHGTHDLNTTFRNRWDGREQNNGRPTSSSTIALRLNPGTRYHNVIGNVLGTMGYHNTYKSNGTSAYNSVITCGFYGETGMAQDSLTCPTSMFWGNYDTVNNAVRWSATEVPSGLSQYSNAVPASQSLPASFIYTSKPSWWPSGKAWPPIGPDVSGGNVGQCSGGIYDSSEAISGSQCSGGSLTPTGGGLVTSIPAMDCYVNSMHGIANGTGGALSFDSSACYSTTTSGGGTPSAPTGLNAVVN